MADESIPRTLHDGRVTVRSAAGDVTFDLLAAYRAYKRIAEHHVAAKTTDFEYLDDWQAWFRDQTGVALAAGEAWDLWLALPETYADFCRRRVEHWRKLPTSPNSTDSTPRN